MCWSLWKSSGRVTGLASLKYQLLNLDGRIVILKSKMTDAIRYKAESLA